SMLQTCYSTKPSPMQNCPLVAAIRAFAFERDRIKLRGLFMKNRLLGSAMSLALLASAFPTVSATPASADDTCVQITNVKKCVNVRVDAGKKKVCIGSLRKGDLVIVVDDSCPNGWCKTVNQDKYKRTGYFLAGHTKASTGCTKEFMIRTETC